MATGNNNTTTTVQTTTGNNNNGGGTNTNVFHLASTWNTTLVGMGWNNSDIDIRALADFDGDGLPDLLAFNPNDFYLAKNLSTSFAAPNTLRDDFTQAAGWTSETSLPRLVGDVNGDGKADIVGFGANSVFVNTATPTGTDTVGEVSFETPMFTSSQGFTSQDLTPRFLADVNGDGKADVVAIDANGVHVGLSSGTAFGTSAVWTTAFTSTTGYPSQTATPRLLADINADGKADLVGFGATGVEVALSFGSGFQAAYTATEEFVGSAWSNDATTPRFVADVTGDGIADFIGIDAAGVHLAVGTKSIAEPSYVAYVGFQPSAGFPSQSSTPRFVIDVNGDKKADVVGFDATNVVVVLAP